MDLWCAQAAAIHIPGLNQEAYVKLGDLNLGILIPVHIRSTRDFCGSSVLSIDQLQRVEALAFAIEEINKPNAIMPNHTLGFVMFDDCHSDQTALAQSLHFTVSTTSGKTCFRPSQMADLEYLDQYDVIGIIGSETSITTLQAANLLTSLQIPQISYFATTPVLSNSGKYSLFQRTVPSDNIQARVLLQLMASFNWSFIYVVYAEGAYGEGLYRALERTLQEDETDRYTCFVEPFVITQDFDHEDYYHIAWTMFQEKAANVCLVIAQEFEAHQLIRAASSVPNKSSIMTWIASDAWARNLQSLKGLLDEIHGMISVNVYSTAVPRFDQHFRSINYSSSSANPWLDEYWQQYFNCSRSTEDNITKAEPWCRPELKITDHPSYYPDNTISLVFDAVKTFALAIDYQLRNNCRDSSGSVMWCVKQGLGEVLRKVTFIGEARDQVEFDENGDGITSFTISNLQRSNSSPFGYIMRKVGLWNKYTKTLNLDKDNIEWAGGVKPMSNCSYPCGVGEAMELHQKRCCWACVRCLDNQYTRTEHGIVSCHNCPEHQWPDQETRNFCLDMEQIYIKADSGLGAGLIVLATIGVIISLVVVVLFLVNNSQPLIKATSRELSYCMLMGITLSYLCMFVFTSEPSELTCFICELGVVIAFTMVYTPLTIKTIRIWRIFEAGKYMNRNPKCVSCASQITLTGSIIALQVSLYVLFK